MRQKILHYAAVVLTAVCLLCLLAVPLSAADMNIRVYVDGTELTFDVPPAVINQRTMVPMRMIFEFLGASVEWIQEESGIRAVTDTLDLYMQLGNPEMTVNGEVLILDVPPCAVNGRTLVPLRAVVEAFSADVTWVQSTTSVIIETPAGKQAAEDQKYAQDADHSLDEIFDSHHIRTSYDNIEYFDLALIGNKLKITCMTTDPNLEAFGIRINKGQLIGIKEVKTGKTCFSVIDLSTLDIPDHAMLEIYTRDVGETSFKSYVYRCLFLDKSGSSYCFTNSRMWEHNLEMLSEWVDPRTYLGGEIPQSIADLSDTICAGLTDDYQKLLAIHDWVSDNIYYDMDDYFDKTSHSMAEIEDILISRHSVCQGYADLVTLLVRAQGIPCRQLSGYALGLSATGYWTEENVSYTKSNHSWNQAYVDHRWINIDTTWDSDNIYENGEYIYGGIDYHLYFDISNLFMSYNHKILSIK